MSESNVENVLIQVRAKLQENQIRLWEPPYYEGEPQESVMEDLARNFSAMLDIRYESCYAAIQELQSHALDKLLAKEKFQSTGVASLKIRVPAVSGQVGGTRLLNVEIKLTDTGADLQGLVGAKLEIPPSNVKLIASGRIVEPTKPLTEQGVANNQQLIALVLAVSAEEAQKESDMFDRVAKIRADAEMLISSQHNSFLSMEDQEGKPIYLPEAERRAIMMGLALHEKGRAALGRDDHAEALVLFLEADREFSSCESRLLQSVDNYGLLNLDIVWCYFCLKSVSCLPDAEARLARCEESFRRSYGENMDRVTLLKGSGENERALIMRLHLLQAVLFFHQNRRQEASSMLIVAEQELSRLKVDESALEMLIDMGYTIAESRTALRATGNNVEAAINEILQRREKRAAERKKAKEAEKLLGTTFSKVEVNPRNLASLVEMGFDREMAAQALKNTENDVTAAINQLQENPEKIREDLAKTKKVSAETNLIENLISFGFDPQMAQMALERTLNDLNGAVDHLLKLQSDGVYDNMLASLLNNGPTSSSTDSATTASPSTSHPSSSRSAPLLETLRREAEEHSAYHRFAQDLNQRQDPNLDYLDLPLQQELDIIREYKNLLNM